ncbi:transcriptional regulator, AraC family [Dyella jiangningensis]|uniref:helix-turn-helix domain-containing protein n=1 Tax=Dyella sp. AtDHG13 TaxID=1938897 RepID=UPI00088F7D52|nr:helix-turn-helix domain-containing protein [Dyella sp. AtDHG13]PXV61552.1 AraC family transcriptional regulator [Dyella sp. AtDHG13]SDJ71716.1 transcriptional regulator, AraC family [Dyella jiangningensis]
MGHHAVVPAPPLDALVSRLWDWDMPPAAHHYERVLPVPGAALIINLHENETRTYSDDAERRCVRAAASVIGGPCLRSQIIDTAEQVRVMGVVFRPGGAHAFTGEDHESLVSQDIGLEDIFGSSAHRLREQLLDTACAHARLAVLEQWLLAHMRMPRLAPEVRYALGEIDARPQVTRIGALVRDTGMSDYRFGRLFRRQVGMGPKRYARLMRFRGVVDAVYRSAAVDWSAVALDGGYGDQSHLVHEFRAFAGMTPTAFMAARGPYPNHLPLD